MRWNAFYWGMEGTSTAHVVLGSLALAGNRRTLYRSPPAQRPIDTSQRLTCCRTNVLRTFAQRQEATHGNFIRVHLGDSLAISVAQLRPFVLSCA